MMTSRVSAFLALVVISACQAGGFGARYEQVERGMTRAAVGALLPAPDRRGQGQLPFFEWDPVDPNLLGPEGRYELWTWERCPTVFNVFFGSESNPNPDGWRVVATAEYECGTMF